MRAVLQFAIFSTTAGSTGKDLFYQLLVKTCRRPSYVKSVISFLVFFKYPVQWVL